MAKTKFNVGDIVRRHTEDNRAGDHTLTVGTLCRVVEVPGPYSMGVVPHPGPAADGWPFSDPLSCDPEFFYLERDANAVLDPTPDAVLSRITVEKRTVIEHTIPEQIIELSTDGEVHFSRVWFVAGDAPGYKGRVQPQLMYTFDSQELREAAAVLIEMADAMDASEKAAEESDR